MQDQKLQASGGLGHAAPTSPTLRFTIGSAAAMGIAGDGLLRTFPWGVNATLFVLLLCGVITWAWLRYAKETPCWGVLAMISVLGLCVAWRDAPTLRALNVAAILALLVLLETRPTRTDLIAGTLPSLLANLRSAVRQSLLAPLRLAQRDIDWSSVCRWGHGETTLRVLRALLIAIPLTGAFVWLFASADAVFKHVLITCVDWISDFLGQGGRPVRHLLWSVVLAVGAFAVLRPVVLGDRWKAMVRGPRPGLGIGVLETAVVLGGLVLVFLLFIAIQFRYLFGGDRLVQTVPGLTYAQYARGGFFALLGVVSLLHLVLMIGSWLVARCDPPVQRLFRGLSLCLIGLTIFVFASAFLRLSLYVDAYGLTRSRFYAAAVLTWLAIVFVLFGVKVLEPRWPFLAAVYACSWLAVLLALNILNPDAWIARINLDRAGAGKELDLAYLDRLSADAAPTLLSAAGLAPDVRSSLILLVDNHNRSYSTCSWRTWNYGRWRSLRLAGSP